MFKGEKSVGVTSYNAAKPFIAVGFSHLDVDTERYLSPNELFFALAREMANIKSGFTKLLSDKLFRDFFNSGAMNIDKISTYIPAPSFISKNTDYYDKYRFASNVFCGYPLWESFESTDKQILVSLEKKLSIIHYKPSTPADLKVCEYAAVSRLMCHYADRLGLLFAGNIVTATNAIIKTDVYQGYGLSEASPIISVNTSYAHKFGSSGGVLTGIKAKIVDPDGNELPAGQKGILCIEGLNVMKGYFKNPEATAEVINGTWLNTGDMGYIDKDNFLYVTGREKALLISSDGEKYSPEAMEDAIVNSGDLIYQAVLYNDHCKYTFKVSLSSRTTVNTDVLPLFSCNLSRT